MWTKQKQKKNIEYLIFYLSYFLIALYYLYHCYAGAYGLQAYSVKERTIAQLNTELSTLLQTHDELNKKVILLRSPNIDKDSLEEYARKNLNVANNNELIILTNRFLN